MNVRSMPIDAWCTYGIAQARGLQILLGGSGVGDRAAGRIRDSREPDHARPAA